MYCMFWEMSAVCSRYTVAQDELRVQQRAIGSVAVQVLDVQRCMLIILHVLWEAQISLYSV